MFRKLSASVIAVIYLVVAGLWIAFTDNLLNALISDPDLQTTFQTYKGLFYVVVTTAGLYFLISKHDSLLAEQKEKIQEKMEAHRAERELLEKLFERIPVMINSYNPDKDQFHVNREFERVTGWNTEEAENDNLTKACFPDPELREEVKAFMDAPNSGWREFPMTTKSGNQIQTTWTNIHLEDDTLVGIGLNITERKKHEQTLSFQQQKLEQAQKLAGLGYWELDLQTDELNWSNGLYQLHGFDPQKTAPSVEEFRKIIHPEDVEKFEEHIPNVIESGYTEFTFRARNANGDMGYFFTSGQLITDENGKRIKIFGTSIDVNEIKKSEAKARRSERLLRKTFDSLQSAVFVVEPGTRRITDCNKHTQRIFGYSRKELIGKSTRILHIDDEHYLDFDIGSLEELQEKGVFNTEYKMQRKNGEIFDSDHTVTFVYDDHDEIDRVVSVVRDITDRKQYERNLRRSKERLHRAQQVGQVGDWEYDPESGEISWSPMVYEIYGLDPNQELPPFDELRNTHHPEDADILHKKVTKAVQKGVPYDLDLQLNTAGGERKFIRAIGIPQKDGAGNVTLLQGTIQDITDRKQAENQALTSLIEGEERERKRIAKELHDGLGQYLSASQMNFETIKPYIFQLPQKRVQQFKTGLELLRDSIDETRNIAHNLMPTAIEDYGLELAVQALIEKLQRACDITFTFKSSLPDIKLKQQAEINLYRVIQEALSNAIKYSECSKISLQLYKHDHIISCMIEDDGIGATIDAQAENQGMGIRSMKTRVQSLSGTIDFESKPEAGMNILIELPLQPNIIEE